MIAIVACDLAGGIGYNNAIPWHLPADLRYFKAITQDAGCVIMGRKTWESLPRKPLPNRLNIVLSRRTLALPPAAIHAPDLDTAIRTSTQAGVQPCIIGGAGIYQLALSYITTVYITRVHAQYTCDVFFPELSAKFKRVYASEPLEDNQIAYHHERWDYNSR